MANAKAVNLRRLTLDELPPYGFMPAGWQGIAEARAPSQLWTGTKKQWNAFVDELRDLVDASVWPVHAGRTGWKKGPVKENAGPMTELELDIGAELRDRQFGAIAVAGDSTTHAELFYLEDDAPWAESFVRHCPGLVHLAPMIERMYHKLPERVGASVLTLKMQFQRPRPYVVSHLQGRDKWTWEHAKTSLSSSMISGHGIMGCMLGCVLFSWLSEYEPELAKKYRLALQQCAVGIGDRRVFAGVHYPSDNLASWIVATRLVEVAVPDPVVRAFLVEAIEGSIVHRELRTVAGGSRGATLEAPLAGLDRALNGMRARVPKK